MLLFKKTWKILKKSIILAYSSLKYVVIIFKGEVEKEKDETILWIRVTLNIVSQSQVMVF